MVVLAPMWTVGSKESRNPCCAGPGYRRGARSGRREEEGLSLQAALSELPFQHHALH